MKYIGDRVQPRSLPIFTYFMLTGKYPINYPIFGYFMLTGKYLIFVLVLVLDRLWQGKYLRKYTEVKTYHDHSLGCYQQIWLVALFVSFIKDVDGYNVYIYPQNVQFSKIRICQCHL